MLFRCVGTRIALRIDRERGPKVCTAGTKIGRQLFSRLPQKATKRSSNINEVNSLLCTDTAHHAADHRRFGGHHRDRERVRSPWPRAPVPRPGTCCVRRVGRRGFRLGRFEWICASLRPSDVVFCRCPSAAIPSCFFLVQAMKAEESPLKKLAIPAAMIPFLAPVAAIVRTPSPLTCLLLFFSFSLAFCCVRSGIFSRRGLGTHRNPTTSSTTTSTASTFTPTWSDYLPQLCRRSASTTTD